LKTAGPTLIGFVVSSVVVVVIIALIIIVGAVGTVRGAAITISGDDGGGHPSQHDLAFLSAKQTQLSSPSPPPSRIIQKVLSMMTTTTTTTALVTTSIAVNKTATSSPSSKAVYLTVWKDPNENAFTMLLPQGWKATGGTLRTISGTNDADFWFNATDPTNKEMIFAANALAYYILPSPTMGLPDGSFYPGSNSPFPNVYYYRNASQYIKEFIVPFLQSTSLAGHDLQITKITDYPVPKSVYSSITTEASGATALLSFTKDGEEYSEGVDIITAGWSTGWYAEVLSGVSAPKNDFDKVTQLSEMILPTFTENVQWAKNEIIQKEIRTGIRTDVQHFLEKTIDQTYAEINAARDASSQAWSEAMRGTHQVQNPATGDKFTVPNSYQYWWVDPRGNLAGTNTDTNPDPTADFKQLEDASNRNSSTTALSSVN
jgi:hypothetical protein